MPSNLAVVTDTPELRKSRGAFFTPDAPLFTQVRTLLIGEEPVIMDDRPARLEERITGMTSDELAALIRQPTKPVPKLP